MAVASIGRGQFLDIDRVVKDWADREYDRTATKKERSFKEKEKKRPGSCIHETIDWSEVKFTDITKWPRGVDDDGAKSDKNDNSITRARMETARPEGGNTSASVLFRTKFTNDTEGSQEYTMKTEKTTRSACTTEVESGFTHGYEMSVALKTPCEIFEANAGYHREMSLTNIDGQTFEEELTWGVESTIQVSKDTIAEATLVVQEKKCSGEFEIETKIRGTVYVSFTNLRDNNSAIKMCANDIADIVEKHVLMERRKGESCDHVDIDNSVVTVRTKGKCKFQFGIEQEVVVHQEPIAGK